MEHKWLWSKHFLEGQWNKVWQSKFEQRTWLYHLSNVWDLVLGPRKIFSLRYDGDDFSINRRLCTLEYKTYIVYNVGKQKP
jgi:hypothetical protein